MIELRLSLNDRLLRRRFEIGVGGAETRDAEQQIGSWRPAERGPTDCIDVLDGRVAADFRLALGTNASASLIHARASGPTVTLEVKVGPAASVRPYHFTYAVLRPSGWAIF